jgi:hypothetical protein
MQSAIVNPFVMGSGADFSLLALVLTRNNPGLKTELRNANYRLLENPPRGEIVRGKD